MRNVKQLSSATQRYRRRILAMLDAWVEAFEHLKSHTDESRQVLRTTDRLRDLIRGMR